MPPEWKGNLKSFGGAGFGEVIPSNNFFLLKSQDISGDLQKLLTSQEFLFLFHFCLATVAASIL